MGQHMAITAMNGAPPPPMPERVSSWAVYEIFNTSDGLQVFIGITSDGQWKRFCEFFRQAELAADPRLATNNDRIEARPWLVPKVAAVFKAYTKAALEQMCLDADISFAPIARPQDLFDNPHLLANGSLAPTTLPGGVKTRLPLLPFQMFGWRPPLVSDPPEIGQHNDEVLAEIGYGTAGSRPSPRPVCSVEVDAREVRPRGRSARLAGRQPDRFRPCREFHVLRSRPDRAAAVVRVHAHGTREGRGGRQWMGAELDRDAVEARQRMSDEQRGGGARGADTGDAVRCASSASRHRADLDRRRVLR